MDEEKGVYNKEDGSLNLNPNSLTVLKDCKVEDSFGRKRLLGDSFQFVRNGYFCIDARDSTPEQLVFNRIVSLRVPLNCQKKLLNFHWGRGIFENTRPRSSICRSFAMNELTINLDPHAKTPLYEQIYRYIKENIQEGKIACGEKLPSTRALSRPPGGEPQYGGACLRAAPVRRVYRIPALPWASLPPGWRACIS